MDLGNSQVTNGPDRGLVTTKKNGEASTVWVGPINRSQDLTTPFLNLINEGLHGFSVFDLHYQKQRFSLLYS